MTKRFLLTLIWLLSFASALLVVESYVHVKDASGIRLLLPSQRLAAMEPMIVTYGSVITSILAFWFVQPVPAVAEGSRARIEKMRFTVALICTFMFNVLILFYLAEAYFDPSAGREIMEGVSTATTLSKWCGFLVAAVNCFYFGTKS